MSEQYFVQVTDHSSGIAQDEEREGPFSRYEDAERWRDETVEKYVEHRAEQYQEWPEEQAGDTADPFADSLRDAFADSRVEQGDVSGQIVVYGATGLPVATYTIEAEEDTDD